MGGLLEVEIGQLISGHNERDEKEGHIYTRQCRSYNSIDCLGNDKVKFDKQFSGVI